MPTHNNPSYVSSPPNPCPKRDWAAPPNGARHMVSPLSSTPIYGKSDAVLVDPPPTTAKAVAHWVLAKGSASMRSHAATYGRGSKLSRRRLNRPSVRVPLRISFDDKIQCWKEEQCKKCRQEQPSCDDSG